MHNMADDPLDIFRNRETVPSNSSSDEWRTVPGWVKERSFWMAGVSDVRIMEAFRTEVERMLEGESSGVESYGRLKDWLDEIGYEPKPGDKGIIRDLSTYNRIQVTLDTNVQMVRAYARYKQRTTQGALQAKPGQKFERIFNRVERREWAKRWQEAYELTKGVPGATPSDGDDNQPGEALVMHPIWTVLSEFNQPYPPFDWGSGMGVTDLDREECEALGLLDDPRARMLIDSPPDRSPNEGLSASLVDAPEEFKKALKSRLKGLARVVDNRVEHTDPNGTRPYFAKDLKLVWDEGMPEGIELPQRAALGKIVSGETILPDTEESDHATNLFNRLVNTGDRPEALYRSATIKADDVDRLTGLTLMSAAFNSVAGVWAASMAFDTELAEDKWRVIYILKGGSRGKDITDLVSGVTTLKEGAWLYMESHILKVTEITRKQSERLVEVTVEELV